MRVHLNDIHVQIIVGNIQLPTRVKVKDRNPTNYLSCTCTTYPHTDLQPVGYYIAQPQSLWQKLWNVTTYKLIHVDATGYKFKDPVSTDMQESLKAISWDREFDYYRVFDNQPIHKLCEYIE